MPHLSCKPCGKGSLAATEVEIAAMLAELPEWQMVEVDGIQRLTRQYRFANFATAIAFTDAVAGIAEAQQHHPAILTEWGKVTVTWWTHAVGGLHKNDFIMAAKTDHLDDPT